MNDEERERKRAEIKALGDLTDPKNNPLVPSGQAEPIDPLMTPAGNPLIAEGEYPWLQSKPNRPAAELVQDLLAVFTANELEISPGVMLQRMAGGNVRLAKDGVSSPIEDATAADLEQIRAALKR